MRLNSYIFSYLLDGEIRVFFAIIFALIIYAGQIYSSWKKTQNKKKKLFFFLWPYQQQQSLNYINSFPGLS